MQSQMSGMTSRTWIMKACMAACAFATVSPGAASAGRQAEIPLQRLRVELGGHPFAVWARVPEAPRGAIVLLHGRTWSGRPAFDLQVPGLQRSVLSSLAARGFAAYAMDQRGYGETPRDKTGWITPHRAAADAAGVLAWVTSRHPGLPKPALLGWSLGAATAHLLAATSPGSLSALILAGYAPDPDGATAMMDETGDPPRLKNDRAAAASDFIAPRVTEPAVVKAFVETALRTDPIHADWKNEGQFLKDPSRITIPTLLIFGDLDQNVEPNTLERFFGRLGAAKRKVVSLPGADHCAMLENTHLAWIAAIVEFLLRK